LWFCGEGGLLARSEQSALADALTWTLVVDRLL